VIVTVPPTGADAGFKLAIIGVGKTVKLTPLLGTLFTVTTTLPLVAPLGTATVMLVVLHAVGTPEAPLNVTVLVPWLAPKFVPAIVTALPTGPDVALKLVMLGVAKTVKLTPLLATPPAVTTTLPVLAPVGTVTVILVALQLVAVAAIPLKVTVPCEPKFVPVIVTELPTVPAVGLKLAIAGVGRTVNVTGLLTAVPTVTITLPVVAPVGTGTVMLVALQAVGVAAVPLNVMELLP
jgi:hypothetical protein